MKRSEIYIYKGDGKGKEGTSNENEWPVSCYISLLTEYVELVIDFIWHYWKLLPKNMLPATLENTVID